MHKSNFIFLKQDSKVTVCILGFFYLYIFTKKGTTTNSNEVIIQVMLDVCS